MTSALQSYPTLSPKEVNGARLFADRESMIEGLGLPKGGVVAEIGVLRGDFSEFLIGKLSPRTFVGFDTFNAHEHPAIWGIPSSEFFEGLTQLEYVRRRLSKYGDTVTLEPGASKRTLPKYARRSFDLVYIDASHDYTDVKNDAHWASLMAKKDGILVFNDYILFDHLAMVPYGIVPVVNTMLVSEGWQVVGFAFQHQLFCDIAIRRRP